MRPFPAIKFYAGMTGIMVVLASSAAFAQGVDNSGLRNALANSVIGRQPGMGMQPGVGMPMPGMQLPGLPMTATPAEEQMTEQELKDQLKDPNSSAYKANALAEKARRNGLITSFAAGKEAEANDTLELEMPVPPEMDALQDIHGSNGTNFSIADEQAQEELMDLDIRRDAQKEAALSYGARGGLAKRSFQIAERLKGYGEVLDGVFNFRALLIRAPSGLLIEPPIVRETQDNIVITDNGNEAAVAERVLDINKQAKIVSAPRDWRQYIDVTYSSDIPPPPKVLWPKDAKEQADWNTWVKQGWDAGYAQGQDSFDTNLNRLVTDYNGMVRYRMLLAQGMISQPYALHEDRGVTGSKTEMRVGDRALRITGPSQFLTGSDLWKPADR